MSTAPTFRFPDGHFSFWTVLFGSAYNDASVVIRVRDDNQPRERAREKGLRGFDRVVPALDTEVQAWFASHADSFRSRGGPGLPISLSATSWGGAGGDLASVLGALAGPCAVRPAHGP